jgi:serine/threonine protein kinase
LTSGYYKDANRYFAIKIIDLEQISAEFRQKFLPREISIWRQLDHKNHVFLYKDFEKSGYQFAIMELGTGGDMVSELKLMVTEAEFILF